MSDTPCKDIQNAVKSIMKDVRELTKPVDIVERLRVTLRDADDVCTDVGSEGADEIESLRQQLVTMKAERDKWIDIADKRHTETVESQAREKVRIEALEKLARLGNEPHYGNSIGNEIAIKALAIPSDSTALDEAIRQAKREAYVLGFNASGEGWNGEWPFRDKRKNPLDDEGFVASMNDDLKN